MNKRQTEYIALYLFVFGAILLFGVLARKFVLVKGYDEFSSAVAFFATVVVLSALYISLQMTLNELLLPRMEKFLMRFPAFQKLEEVAVADTPAAVVETIEEVVVAGITPQPSQYEILRANAIAKQEHASQAKLERVLDYTKQTMVAYMSEAELDRLCGYITEYSLGDTTCEVSPVSVDSALKSIDLMHFGWNIGKAFGKKRIHTATFIKRVFAHALRDIEVSTIERKMSHTESEWRIRLNNNIA
ncbi:MAG: mobilization protein [Bacteroidales bacterium]|nr:mobilization protein [Bacteroidales bacterium]MBQ8811729.1 mobilization protein [Bacteroidales bacterium]